MSGRLRPTTVKRLLVLAVMWLILFPTRADALSCPTPVDQSPESVAAGTAKVAGGGEFRDVWAGVLFGRVAKVSDAGQSYLIEVDVTGWYGASFGPTADLYLLKVAGGPSVEEGEHRYLAYSRSDGRLRWPLCGPTREIDVGRVPALMAAARAAAWPETGPPPTPSPSPTTAPTQTSATSPSVSASSDGPPMTLVATGLGLMAITWLLVRRRRRRSA